MDVREEVRKMKADVPRMAASSLEVRNDALGRIASRLEENRDKIFAANKLDMEAAEANGVAASVQKRLKYNEAKLRDSISGIMGLIWLDDPVGRTLLKRQLDDNLILTRVSVPIGVIGVIFEARPDALIQVASLCIKSGNCAVLKGGKETSHTNKVLFDIIKECVIESGLPQGSLLQVEAHSEIDELLECNKSVDLIIPRGSNQFVQYIMNNTKIPVMGHADGICHTYIDKDADIEKACNIILDAKTQYTAACNATETLLVDRSLDKEALKKIAKNLEEKGHVKLRGTKEVNDIVSVELMNEDEFNTEYLDLVISIKLVDGVDEAISHINTYGSHHTDAIITENAKTAEKFMELVDSAGVYQNCSTRFADGFRYGFGAEVGISTSKIHARGPVGLEGLTTYKYKLRGSGQIVGDYASGKANFNFKDL
ncbi:MAG TPA: glutamate-5-semialdehyde dehydrogenase [Lachnospiraceae bacterium]|nr:glutamate-5-semialdehyde dehydrogenase [Lachnospiraceae bacterium]